MKRVLVVDDNESIRTLIRRMLKKLPVQVKEAEDGEQALFLHEHETYDLIVTDIILPRIDGAMLARTLRARFPTLPVIMMSGQFIAPLESCRYLLFLRKPFDAETLVHSVSTALGIAANVGSQGAGVQSDEQQMAGLPAPTIVNNH